MHLQQHWLIMHQLDNNFVKGTNMSSSKFQKGLLASSIAIILGSAVAMPVMAEDATDTDGKKAKTEKKVDIWLTVRPRLYKKLEENRI